MTLRHPLFNAAIRVSITGKLARILLPGCWIAAERKRARAGQGEGERPGAFEHLHLSNIIRAGAEDPGAAG